MTYVKAPTVFAPVRTHLVAESKEVFFGRILRFSASTVRVLTVALGDPASHRVAFPLHVHSAAVPHTIQPVGLMGPYRSGILRELR
jgi:hypothetical protein